MKFCFSIKQFFTRELNTVVTGNVDDFTRRRRRRKRRRRRRKRQRQRNFNGQLLEIRIFNKSNAPKQFV